MCSLKGVVVKDQRILVALKTTLSHHIQCNLDYPDLVYPDSRLSGLASDQILHYHACAEGVANDILWVWSQVER